jgi:glyoxylase-like metal-dependent hydrolase (beta-lactamase superfamily II)
LTLHLIDAGHFKLDGGAMFGVVPKVIWEKLLPADSNNHVSFAMRCLLIEDGNRLLLIDCGMGDKQDARWQSFYYRHGEGDLVKSIQAAGFSPTEITDVLPSHLHFDHAGGAVRWNLRRDGYELTFPNARYWAHSAHWAWATQHPNPREKASFLRENLEPIAESGHLHFIDQYPEPFGPNVELLTVDGHTEKMVLPKLTVGTRPVVFTADLIPTTAHIPVNYLMSYDVRPLQTMDEKASFLRQAADENWLLISDHDPVHEAYTVQATEKGYRLREAGSFKNLF